MEIKQKCMHYRKDNFWVLLMIEVETLKQALILTAANILHCGQ